MLVTILALTLSLTLNRPNLHRQVNRGVEAETALVGAQRRVELDAVAAVDLELALVVLPDDAELDDALRDGSDL